MGGFVKTLRHGNSLSRSVCSTAGSFGFQEVRTASDHWEIKGRFRKRVVLANVPSFRFSFRGNIRRNHPFGNHPCGNHQLLSLGDKRAVSKRVVLANVPSFRFSFRGNIRQNHPFGNRPFANPRSDTEVGAFGGSALSDRIGRKWTLCLSATPMILSYGLLIVLENWMVQAAEPRKRAEHVGWAHATKLKGVVIPKNLLRLVLTSESYFYFLR